MPGLSGFSESWGSNRTSVGRKIKELISPPPPLRQRIALALYKLKVQNNHLEYMVAKLRERDRRLFEKVVEAHIARDKAKASMYAAEVAEIRKIAKTVMTAKLALERVTLRLETIREMGDILVALGPVMGVIKELREHLMGVMPETALELREVDDLLESIIVDAGEFMGVESDVLVASEDAKKILQEAAAVAEQRMKEQFPELPSLADASATSQNLSQPAAKEAGSS